MAQKVEVEAVIGKDGQVHLEVKGMKGKACLDVTAQLEAEIGEVVERKRKPEFYQENAAKQVIKT